MMIRTFLAALALSAVVATPAHAQTEAEFAAAFSGEWVVVDQMYGADNKTCTMALSDSGEDGVYGLSAVDCNLELADVTGWRLVEGQMLLLSGEDTVATLGGNQTRMSGISVIGAPIVLDRSGSNALLDQIAAARETSGCYYLGFSNTCADEAQLTKPAMSGDGSPPRISVLVNLNARVEARDDAEVLGVVPANSCIVADTCLDTADGVWCRATFGEQAGWLKKVALRQQTWPVVTFVNQCSAPTE